MTVGMLSFGCVLYQDGAGGAPSGTPQNATLLAGYSVRAPWNVAGVDYAVGIHPGTTLKNPAVDALPSGVTYSSTHLTINSASAVILDGWDFTTNSSWFIQIQSPTPSVTFTNCKFGSISTSGIIAPDAGITCDLTISYCEYSHLDFGIGPAQGCLLIYGKNAGNITFTYNYVHNTWSDVMTNVSGANWNVVYKYNYITGLAKYPAEHCNYLEFNGAGTTNIDLEFNTFYQLPIGQPGGEIMQFYQNNNSGAGLLQSCISSNNTVIVSATNPAIAARQNSHAYTLADSITVPGSACTYYKCYTAGTSASSQPALYATGGDGTQITDGTAVFNAQLVSPGTNGAASVVFHGPHDAGSSANNTPIGTGPFLAQNNFIDPRGLGSGVDYSSGAGPTYSMGQFTWFGNRDMVNGKTINVNNTEV